MGQCSLSRKPTKGLDSSWLLLHLLVASFLGDAATVNRTTNDWLHCAQKQVRCRDNVPVAAKALGNHHTLRVSRESVIVLFHRACLRSTKAFPPPRRRRKRACALLAATERFDAEERMLVVHSIKQQGAQHTPCSFGDLNGKTRDNGVSGRNSRTEQTFSRSEAQSSGNPTRPPAPLEGSHLA